MSRALRLALVLQTLLAISPALMAQPAGGRELLEFVRNAHRAARESIRTCSCRVEFSGTVIQSKSTQDKTQTCSGRFWYGPDAVRSRYQEFGSDRDYLWKDSVTQEVARSSSPGSTRVVASRNRFAIRHIGRCDAYVRGLLVLNVPGTIRHVPFEELVERATRFEKAERKTADGKERVVVRLTFQSPRRPTWDVEIQFDHSVNYLVCKTSYYSSGEGTDFRRQDEVLSFKESAPGVFFPERLAGHSGTVGEQPDFNHTTVISDIVVNRPIPDAMFQFHFLYGVELADGIRGVSYKVDREGNQISKAIPLVRGTPPPPLGDAPPSGEGTETREEPQPATRWILSVSVILMVIAGGAALVRRWRLRAGAE